MNLVIGCPNARAGAKKETLRETKFRPHHYIITTVVPSPWVCPLVPLPSPVLIGLFPNPPHPTPHLFERDLRVHEEPSVRVRVLHEVLRVHALVHRNLRLVVRRRGRGRGGEGGGEVNVPLQRRGRRPASSSSSSCSSSSCSASASASASTAHSELAQLGVSLQEKRRPADAPGEGNGRRSKKECGERKGAFILTKKD